MKLTLEGIKDRKVWEEAGISLPSYDVEAVAEATREKPVWVHFGAGNIFRIFIGGIADVLISEGMSGKGITCAETFDFDVIEKIYKPYDNLVLGVTLKADGSTDKKVIGSLTEALKAQAGETRDWKRLKDIFADPGLQIASFTITEKGYALRGRMEHIFHLSRRILTMGRKMPYRPWLSCAAFYTKDIKPEKRLWQWYPWTIAPTTEKSFRNPLPPWQRNGTRESMWRTGLSHICPIASRYPFRGP